MDREQIQRMVGWVKLESHAPVEAGSYGTWTLTIHVGEYGIDDGGTILLARRWACDWGIPQTTDPAGSDYCTVWTDGRATLRAHYNPKAYIRPWASCLVIDILDGYLAEGETVTVGLGDRSQGSPGSRAQTFCEKRFQFRVLIDCFASGQFLVLPDSPIVPVVSGPAAELMAILPSEAFVGHQTWALIKAEDRWQNPAADYTGRVELKAAGGIEGIPAEYTFTRADEGVHRFEGLLAQASGEVVLRIRDTERDLAAQSNPLLIVEQPRDFRPIWGDLHGQSEETLGTNTVFDYFAFARDKAGIDFCCHQGNDFQVTAQTWDKIKEATQLFNEPGRFVTLLGIEWTSNTGAGGDHNIIYKGDDGPLHRASHWQIEDTSDADTDRHPVEELYRIFRDQEIIIIPHVGGRRATLDQHLPSLEPVIEVLSATGCFEWFLDEALERGYRVGFICGSDGHKGRPGASHPGASLFGIYGGLCCAYARELTREALWEALKARRVYGTSGQRIILRFFADSHWMGEEFQSEHPPRLTGEVVGTGPLERVEIRHGLKLARTLLAPGAEADASPLIRIAWSGARIKQRKRQTIWDGSIRIEGGRFARVEAYAFDNPLEGILNWGPSSIEFSSTTSGDADGVFIEVDGPPGARLIFESPIKTCSLALSEITHKTTIVEAGGIRQQVTFQRIPVEPGPNRLVFDWVAERLEPGWNPFYLRVIQRNGAMAWSSPIYVYRVTH